MDRVYNFSAGPACLPLDVLKNFEAGSIENIESNGDATTLVDSIIRTAMKKRASDIHFEPFLGENIGLGYVKTNKNLKIDDTIQIMIRNKMYNAIITIL